MEEITARVKKWGNSYGIIIPKKVMEAQGLKEEGEVVVTIKPHRAMTVRQLMDAAKKYPVKKINKSTEEIMKEIDKDLYGIER